ncbi:MAG: nucleotidyltransferase domain-containing protein [Saprospiraceae bacterium]
MIELKPYHKAIQEICKSQGVKRLELFGSYARNDFKKDSDMDFLVEFD